MPNEVCQIEHDEDSFEGSRNGGQWYHGTLMCCGAEHKFHRYYSDSKTETENCFSGPHTTNLKQVGYNRYSIKPCTKEDCGEENFQKAVQAYKEQERQRQEEERARTERRGVEREQQQSRIDELLAAGKQREARHLRAEMLGIECAEGELDSDVDSDGCAEFDYASDSSLVPPWLMD